MDIEQKAEISVGQIKSTDRKEAPNSGPVSRVKKLVSRRLLVGIKDGRFFLGTFYCMDKQGNIILQDAVEYRSTRHSSPSPMEQRGLGLILIPFSCRTSCHVDCSIEEQMSLLSLEKQK
ncbi:OLC1v1008655C1 [Oldenlandia corymbosa var. corymbosa]|uniref:OLC1v1008655C1 n=1 Tax=Oldenlandia corymbosa var. corymbosa TaxID=529605 RepID=A0AAV1DM72_OLDCO|nr:OLC1v1008655C1 [Oldenlandia corymbosa var. corymbosa]